MNTNTEKIQNNVKVTSTSTGVLTETKGEIGTAKTEIAPCMFNGMSNEFIEQKLQEMGYEIHDKFLCSIKIKQNINTGELQKEYMPISNFLPLTSRQLVYKNGRDKVISYVVEGFLTDSNTRLPSITVSEEELNKGGYLSNSDWKCKAILRPTPYAEKHVKYIFETLSKDIIKRCEIYSHTGFTRIGDDLVYLYHGGVIGKANNIDVDLSQDKLERYSFTNKEFDLNEALTTSYSILDVADVKITIPLLATTYLAPLTTIFSENDIFADYLIWFEGPTGTRKSSLMAVMSSHYGKFNRDSFPCSFRDTINSLEKKVFILKDSLVCVDDFNPETGSGKIHIAEKLFAMSRRQNRKGQNEQRRSNTKKPIYSTRIMYCYC